MEKWSDFKKEIKSLSKEELLYIEFLAEITQARTDKRLTQREVAEMTGLLQPAIARLESPSGKNNATLMTVIKYLDALDMKLTAVPKEIK